MTWSTTPTYTPRPQGGRWSVSPTVTLPPVHPTWFSAIEKVCDYKGEGSLSIRLGPKLWSQVAFQGVGDLFKDIRLSNSRNAYLSGLGLPTAKAYEAYAIDCGLAGFGNLERDSDDGLHAEVFWTWAAFLDATGALSAEIVGGRPPVDGLYADAYQRYLLAGLFSSTGELVSALNQVSQAIASLSGGGSLTASTTFTGFNLANLVGSGQLSAQAFGAFLRIVNLAGSGAITASTLTKYLQSIGFTGAGSLVALAFQMYAKTAAPGGSGTVGAVVKQIYALTAAMAGSGGLSAGAAFAVNGPTTAQYTTTGALSHTVPWWCNKFDGVVLGGGGGGGGASIAATAAQGGDAGVFGWQTYVRGVDIPWTTTSFSGTVGTGGTAGTGTGNGGNGGASSITVNGKTLSGSGGTGRGGGGTQNGDAVSSGNANSGKDVSLNGSTYAGGATSTTTTANVPGAGGRGANGFSNGNAGARGRVWIKSYQ